MKILAITPISFSSNNKETDKNTYSGLMVGASYSLLSGGMVYGLTKILEKKVANDSRSNAQVAIIKKFVKKGFWPSLAVNMLCGGVVDYFINKERKNNKNTNSVQGSDYKSNAGTKYGGILGLLVGATEIAITLIKHKKISAIDGFWGGIDHLFTKAAGGAILGWTADKISDKQISTNKKNVAIIQ